MQGFESHQEGEGPKLRFASFMTNLPSTLAGTFGTYMNSLSVFLAYILFLNYLKIDVNVILHDFFFFF